MVRVELAVVDHLSPNVIFPQMLSFRKILSFHKCYLSAKFYLSANVIIVERSVRSSLHTHTHAPLLPHPFLIFTQLNATVSYHHHQCKSRKALNSCSKQTNNNTIAASAPNPATLLLNAKTEYKYFHMTERTHVPIRANAIENQCHC